jgi:hypothetical protein
MSDLVKRLRTLFFGPKPKDGADCFYCANLSSEGACCRKSDCAFRPIRLAAINDLLKD